MVGAFTGLNPVVLHAQSAGSESAKDPLLDTLNNEFRDQYRQALAATLAQAGPVILEEGDNLILIHKGERASVLVKPVEYHELKAVAHIPLALFVMLSFPQEANLSSDRLQRLRHYRELMEKARTTLPARHYTSEQLARQQKIFSASLELLDEDLADGHVNAQRLGGFTREIGPLLLTNVADATAMEMRDLYATAAAWRKQLTPAEWNALHMVMIGPHMPRDQECSIQFFERLFREPEEGRRIIYAEALWNEKDALSLLATHVVDEAAGEAFFGDPMRMHRDLLADAAKAYLDAHPLAP
jgi:DNA-binding ferritin-like protein (Dps family)